MRGTDGEQDEGAGAGPVGYVLCRPLRAGGARVAIELCTTPDGRRVLPLYSSLTTLVLCCGTAQHWAGVRVAALAHLRRALGADAVALDVPLRGRSLEYESIRW